MFLCPCFSSQTSSAVNPYFVRNTLYADAIIHAAALEAKNAVANTPCASGTIERSGGWAVPGVVSGGRGRGRLPIGRNLPMISFSRSPWAELAESA